MDAKNSTKSKEIKKPHHYGKRKGVHLFHATMPEHDQLIGKHVHNPSDEDLHAAIDDAKKSGVSMVVIHGTPPESLRSKLNEEIGTLSPGQIAKSDVNSAQIPKVHTPQANVGVKPASSFYNDKLLARKAINTGYGEANTAGPHPITPHGLHTHLKAGSYSLLTAHNPMGQQLDYSTNQAANERLKGELESHGAIYHNVKGKYGGNEEQSFLVHHTADVSPEKLEGFAKKYGQESIIHSSEGQHRMVHVGGANEGKHYIGEGHIHEPEADDNYSQVDDHPQKKFALNFSFDQMHGQEANIRKTDKIYFADLKKAFTQNDQQTFTDIKAHTGAVSALHPKLMEWGTKKLATLPKDAIETLELDGKVIKVRKLDSDLYSGWLEKDGNKLHSFERITMPELMMQLQSKLELYGREDSVVVSDLEQSMKNVHAMGAKYLQSIGHEMPSHEELMKPSTGQKLRTIKQKIDSKKAPPVPVAAPTGEIQEVVPNKELMPGMLKPEPQCGDCGSDAAFCDCYQGLSRPRLEFDGKKVTVFFKSEWALEDRENFVEDLKLRAGQILKSRLHSR